MFAKIKIFHKKTQQLLHKMANFMPTIDGLSSALLLLYLLATLYIGMIIIDVQGFEDSLPASKRMTTWHKMYNDDNSTQIKNNKVNTGGNHHMVEDMGGVVVIS